MGRYAYADGERELNAVLAHQDEQLKGISFPDPRETEGLIASSERMLESLGYELPTRQRGAACARLSPSLAVPTWEQMLDEALRAGKGEATLEELFTAEELRENRKAVIALNEQYDQVHRLDAMDWTIASAEGLLAAAVDILLVGIPKRTPGGPKTGPLSDYIRDCFDKRYPADEVEKLAGSNASRVPYDAQDNRNATTYVEGLSAYYHRLLSRGHDPLLGFVLGVSDILSGRMTTIDKAGNVVSQVMECYGDRREVGIFLALAKQVAHLKSDVATAMGLPAPLMSLFNLMQFGSIGE